MVRGMYVVILKKISWKLWGLQCSQETHKLGPLVVAKLKPQGAENKLMSRSLVQCIFGVNMKKIGWKLGSLESLQENPFWPPSGHKWNRRVPKINWHLDLCARDMWSKNDWMRIAEFRVHTRNPCGSSSGSGKYKWQMHSIPDFCSGIQLLKAPVSGFLMMLEVQKVSFIIAHEWSFLKGHWHPVMLDIHVSSKGQSPHDQI